MKKILASILIWSAVVQHVNAWGPTGHRVTGLIAEKHLSKKARSAVAKILGEQSLAMASTWMDEIRSDSAYNFMTDWHWVTIPRGSTYEETVPNPSGDIVSVLRNVISELKSGKLAPAEERDRLKVLVHLVGDIHQPLHVGDRDDRGGNDARVMWFREASNLHRVWDSDMIDETRLSYTELALSLHKPTVDEVRKWQNSSILDWAKESQSYHGQLYETGDGRLGYRYSYVNFPIVRHRLLQAGVRLAGILNEIYK